MLFICIYGDKLTILQYVFKISLYIYGRAGHCVVNNNNNNNKFYLAEAENRTVAK